MTRRSTVKLFDKIIDVLLSRKWQIKLSRHIFTRANGEGDGDPESNGEYYLLEKIKAHYRGRTFTAFDIGANLGEWTVKIAQNIGAGAAVYSFEPSKETYRRLTEQIGSKKFSARIETYNIGLSDKTGSADFYLCAQTAGTNSLYKRQAEAVGVRQTARETIILETGDKFCQAHAIEHIDFVKVDTEGHELSVLKGFTQMLGQGKIDMVQFEYGGTWIDARTFLADVFNFILPLGYCIGKIFPRGIKVFDSYDQRLDNFVYGNYLVFKPDNELVKRLKI